MTDEQIIALVKEHFIEEEVDDDGYCWIEYAGKPDVFLKFANMMYKKGCLDGAYEQSKRYMESVFDAIEE